MKQKLLIFFTMIFLIFSLSSASNETITASVEPPTYKFQESIVVFGDDIEYAIFGDWPQTVKSARVTVDESQSEEHGAFTYYKGSDGYWYCKIVENGYETQYFRVEPLLWRVVTRNYNNTNKALLLCESVLDASCFFSESCYRLIDDKLVYPNNYKESEVRAYLNGLSYNATKDVATVEKYYDFSSFLKYVDELSDEEKPLHYSNDKYLNKGFLQTAFTEKAQQMISVTEVDNSYVSNVQYPVERMAPWNTSRNDYACENTYDKVFLLSEYEVTQGTFGFGNLGNYGINNVRTFSVTDFAKARGVCDYYSDNQHYTFWWLRTPMNGDWRLARFVAWGCSADNMSITNSSGGIIPAICVSLE